MATVTLTPSTYSRRSERIALKNNSERTDVVEKAFAIASYYIPYLLRSSVPHELLRGLPRHYLVPPQHPSELFIVIAELCTHLEQEHHSFFDSLAERIDVNADNAKTLFMNVSKEAFVDSKINWGRVVSIFTLAGTFSVFFAKKGQLAVVQKVPKWVQEFVNEELADWIKEQGGWDDCMNKLSHNGAGNWPRLLAFGGVCAAGYILLSAGLGR